ncbi:MAG: formylglycine-generating enzyme family protein, partial [Sedimentisphaerales bacterium]|nr:formylglycine-generating enzyme family protein [Sedimentisphaerales bacterium]
MRRPNSRQYQAWIVLLTAILWMAIDLARAGVPSSGPIAPEQGGQQRQARPLPDDLVAVADAQHASLDGLAPGSREAQERQRQAVRQLGLPLEVKTAKTGIVLRLIPAGSFTMGSPRAEQDAMVKAGVPRNVVEDEVEHQVTLSKPFYCGKCEVTQGQWEQVMGTNPSYFKNAGKDAPVERVSWHDCQALAKKLCEMEGVAEGTYRLLTEAEWEYACRAGTQTALYNGDLVIKGLNDALALDGISWYGGNSGVEYAGGWDSSGWREKQYNHSRAGTHVI